MATFPPDTWFAPVAPEDDGVVPLPVEAPPEEPMQAPWPPPAWLPTADEARDTLSEPDIAPPPVVSAVEEQPTELFPSGVQAQEPAAPPPEAAPEPLAVEPGAPPEAVLTPEGMVPVREQRADRQLAEQDMRARVAELEALPPEERAYREVQRAADQADWLREQQLAALRADREQAERNDAALATARERATVELQEISTRATELLKGEVDPNRWWSDRSTGQKVAAMAAAVMGGFLSPYRGGRNDGIGMIMDAIDRDVEAQKASFIQQRTLLGDQRQAAVQGLDIARQAYRDAEARRLAALDRLDEELGAQQAALDPRGTTAQAIVAARDNLRARRAEAAAKQEQQLFDRQMKLANLELKQAETAAKLAKTRGAGVGGPAARRRGPYPAELRGLPPAEQKLVFRQGVIDPVSGKYTRRGDESFVIAPTEKIATELNRQGARVASVNEMVNQLVSMRREAGWEPTSKWWSSEAGKRMKSLASELLLMGKDAFNLGVLSGDDLAILEDITGGDPTGIQDPRPALQDMRDRMISRYNQERTSLARGSQPLTFTKTTAPPKQSLRNVQVKLKQAPNLRTGDVITASERLADSQNLYQLLVEEYKGNYEKASAEYVRLGQQIRDRQQLFLEDIEEAWAEARPDNWEEMRREQLALGLAAARLGPDATQREVLDLEDKVGRATRRLENSLSPRAKRLRQAYEEQRAFLEGFDKKLAGEARALSEQQRHREKREEQLERFKSPTSPMEGLKQRALEHADDE